MAWIHLWRNSRQSNYDKLPEIKHVLVQMISLSKLGRLKLGEAQQAHQDVDGDLSKVR